MESGFQPHPMSRTGHAHDHEVDLSSCEHEPIHIPGSIQPHGMLLAIEGDDPVVTRASRNAGRFLGLPLDAILGHPLHASIGQAAAASIARKLSGCQQGNPPTILEELTLGPDRRSPVFNVLGHRTGDETILEFEPAGEEPVGAFHSIYQPLQGFLSHLDKADTAAALLDLTVAEVRRVTGFDRVLVYRFDDDGNGTVVAEDRNDKLPSYLGHRFPASDIPALARELYRVNRFRMIPDASYEPVPIVPDHGKPLDLTFSVLRSVSPLHVEYMRNMGTAASVSVSIVRDGRLWGLISCHHAAPRQVSFTIRASCDFIARLLSVQLSNIEQRDEAEQRLRLGSLRSELITALTATDDLAAGLAGHADTLMSIASADGVAILFGSGCHLLGECPPESSVRRLADWLSRSVGREVYSTDCLHEELDWPLDEYKRFSGLLALSISKLHSNYILWFRPGQTRTVVWAGDPRKPAAVGASGGPTRLSPRISFEAWRETVRGRSAPWLPAELEAVTDLRNAIVGVVLRVAEERGQVNEELRRSNEELEAFSYSVSHDLRAPFRHIVGYAELLRESAGDGLGTQNVRFIDTIIDSARYAGTLVDNLLAFSRMGRTTVHPVEVDMNTLLAEAVEQVSREATGREVRWRLGDLPPTRGDIMMLRLALVNLLSNAVKYTRPRPVAIIEVGGLLEGDETVYHVRDNGIGFDMTYADKLFGVFQRLHRMEDFEGTGIGLANVRRIMARHGGRVWGEGVVQNGATFYFALPRTQSPGEGASAHAETDPPGRGQPEGP